MQAALEQWVHGRWSARGLVPCLLSPLSLIYLAVSRYRASRIKPERLPVPVVVVGNIYVGGTGKTPVTIQLVRELRHAGFHPGVISRGFGRTAEEIHLVTDDSDAKDVGDEPLLIAQQAKCPVAVGRRRILAGRLLLAKHPEVDVIISDDGLQHLYLERDIELAVVGARGIGNGWVLPAGPLREPPSRLDSVDAIILNATNDTIASRTPRYAATSQLGSVTQLATGKVRSINDLSHRIAEKEAKVLCAAGIAAPQRFFATLRAHDIEGKSMPLGDHFDFKTNPFASSDAEFIFITGKDAVKCRQIPEIAQDERVWVADLEMQLDPFFINNLIERVRQLKDEKSTAR